MKLADTSHTVQLKIPATYQYLNVIGACISAMLEKAEQLSDTDTLSYNIELAVHEICINIVEHAYAGLGGAITLKFTVAASPHRFIIEITDSGQSFDLSEISKPNLEEPQIRGYGLFLVYELMDEVVYLPETANNCWCLTKNL
ncbi:MAG: ATP-binding protein [Chloroflexi bacterium]|nr:ATP-binding protein [Chloroflexota bacterium]